MVGDGTVTVSWKVLQQYPVELNILFVHERQREAETQADGDAGSMQGARLDPGPLGSRPEQKTEAPPLSHRASSYVTFCIWLLSPNVFRTHTFLSKPQYHFFSRPCDDPLLTVPCCVYPFSGGTSGLFPPPGSCV
ncbi:hypothetical protein VULLAG_LOCUS7514 [Vulpes lagopus]